MLTLQADDGESLVVADAVLYLLFDHLAIAGMRISMQNLISALSKSGMGSFDWSGTGVWAGSSGQNLFNPNDVPAIDAGIGGAAGAEAGTKAINDAKSRLGK
ncbi:hypothetical protein [Burkholderia ubonensis]|uniref:hypothetical protein n=1 Tax=Burkholderia ubonensis TaxID=101571 RepID=UPI0012FBFA3F|nr:hypothetical protein [Burkholderia ubonensis]